ncbi:MAG: hypothetical protein AAFX87_23395 [Bacteroidota bacterium]
MIKSISKLLFIFLVVCLSCKTSLQTTDESTLQQQYKAAVADAEIVEPQEVYKKLTAITADNEKLVWKNIDGAQHVLVLTWTSWDGYDDKVDKKMQLSREVWVTVVPELKAFVTKHKVSDSQLDLRLERLLGLPPHNKKTRLIEMWVKPTDLFRPSPDPEIDDHQAELTFPAGVSEAHKEWFDKKKQESYINGGYPWTRLGYTYDWGNKRSEVGLSEFVVREGASVWIKSASANTDYFDFKKTE